MTASIKFEKVLRDCGYNDDILRKNEKRGLLYDYNVLIDGEHRAIMRKHAYGVGYGLCDADHEPIKEENRRGELRSMDVRKKDDFEGVIQRLIEAGRIPTLAQMDAAKAERVQKIAAKKAAEVERQRIHLIECAGVDLYEALKAVMMNPSIANIAQAETALAKAEGRS